jgi:hypothetical protein
VRHPLRPVQRQAGRGLLLRSRHRLEAAAPDLAQVRRRVRRETERDRDQRIDDEAQRRQAEYVRKSRIKSGVPGSA